MKIIDNQIYADLKTGKPLQIDLGSGGAVSDGFYGVDFVNLPGVAIQADLNEPLSSLPDNCVSVVRSSHCLEHISQLLPLMRELHRIVRPGGTIKITVPHFSNPYGYSDPTHVRFFGIYTFNYFVESSRQPVRKVPGFYTDVRFDVISINVSLMKRSLLSKLMYPALRKNLNTSFERQDHWERTLCWSAPADEISFELRPVK